MPSPFPNLPPFHRGSIRSVDYSSRLLRDNPWGDPSHRDLWVYTPQGYGADATRYPVVMFLPGFAGSAEGMLARSLSEVSLSSRIDRLIAGYTEDGEETDPCPPFIAVLPDCLTSLGGSQYVDSPALGLYASFLVDEVMPFIEGRFQTSGRWGVVGRSSGGFGALSLAMRRPGRFEAVACHAGDMGFDLCYLGDIPGALRAIRKAEGPQRLVEAFWSSRSPSGDQFAALNLLCMAAAYGPNPDLPDFPAALPCDWRTGEVEFGVLQGWKQRHDPLVQIEDPAAQDALRALRCLFLDAGEWDEYHLQLGARRLVARLSALGVPHTYEEFPGGHRGTSWRYDVSIPRLVQALWA